MKLQRMTYRFLALLVVLILFGPYRLSAGQAGANWTYNYYDDFETGRAEQDSYSHSVFWPREAFPPAEPFLYYYEIGGDQGLVFTDYQGQPAHLSYCFPLGSTQTPGGVHGSLEIDVQFPHNCEISQSPPGYLLYSTSSNGQHWSTPAPLTAGQHNILLGSPQGRCYIVFLGTRVLVDDLSVCLHSPPATIYVPADFDNIQDAIDEADNGDVVEVAPGTYRGRGNVDVDFKGKAITVRSAAGPEQTIIDCDGSSGSGGKQHRGFYFHSAEGASSILQGFTICSGRIPGSEIPPDDMRWNLSPAQPIGGGIYCEFSSPAIINCVIRDCGTELGGGIGCVGGAPSIVDCLVEDCAAGGFGYAESGGLGGGIGLIRGCNAKIVECIVRNNTGYYNSWGGGVYCRRSSAAIIGCDISSNGPIVEQAAIFGGGVYCGDPQTRVVLHNCILSNNAAHTGSAIYTERGPIAPDVPDCRLRVTNCTVAHNRVLDGPWMGPLSDAAIRSAGSDIIVKNSIVWHNEGLQIAITDPAGNSPVVYSDVQGGFPGAGNIDKQPLFAPTDVADYHLQSLYGRYDPRTGQWVEDTQHSPCIDGGAPVDPVGQEPVPNGRRINMGAYGGTTQASKSAGCFVCHVDGVNGDDHNDGLSRQTAFATIQKGIDSASSRDTVLVWPAVYEEQVNFEGKGVTVRSAAEPAVVVAPIGYAFSFSMAEGHNSVLKNFIIRNSEYAIFCYGASPVLSNLTIVNNDFGVAAYEGRIPDIANCIFWNNTYGDLEQCGARYSCIRWPIQNEGEGNISDDPLFADPNCGDYHLRSEYGRYRSEDGVWVMDEVTSPCIDTGDPDVQPPGESMPNGDRLNMGAYGGTAYAGRSPRQLRGDVNNDGLVNTCDIATITHNWLKGTRGAQHSWWLTEGDVNYDGVVNMRDFAVIAHNWRVGGAGAHYMSPLADVVIPVDVSVIPAPCR